MNADLATLDSHLVAPYLATSTNPNHIEIKDWCHGNGILATYYGRVYGKTWQSGLLDYWVVPDGEQRMLFAMRWA